MQHEGVILGAGVTGLACSAASGYPVYEAEPVAGGICSSYYVRPGRSARLTERPRSDDAYQFEIGGGHWIFGGEPSVLGLIETLAPCLSVARHSAVYFASTGRFVPFPLQNHLAALDRQTAARALDEVLAPPATATTAPTTMAEWLHRSFGPTLTELFFGPFHERYTAGLWTRIAPQDAYKSPIDARLVRRGAEPGGASLPIGYNTVFRYPRTGLDVLIAGLASRADVHCGKSVVAIDPAAREVAFGDGDGARYQRRLVSTLPLNRTLELAGLCVDDRRHPPHPFTSVLVLNIGAVRGSDCPNHHWLYVPDSASGFYRVGLYDNVSPAFLPTASRTPRDRAGLYVERAWLGGERPGPIEIEAYARSVVEELSAWGFITEAEVVDPTWVDVAYTWTTPGSTWDSEARGLLEEHGIDTVGRYARWTFQGIADSIRDGLVAGATARMVADTAAPTER